MNNYELLCVINSEWAEGDITKAERMMTTELEKVGGRVHDINKMGNRRLAYPIKGQTEGIYLVFYFAAPPASVSALRANLKLNPGILRILIIKTKYNASLKPDSTPSSEAPEKEKTEVKQEAVENQEKEEQEEKEEKKERTDEEKKEPAEEAGETVSLNNSNLLN